MHSWKYILQVGLDVNVVAHSAWLAAPLQFVAGLGPRKSQLLSRAVQREEFVQTRSDLYKGLGVLGKHVFRCVPLPKPCVVWRKLAAMSESRLSPICFMCPASGHHPHERSQ